MQNDLDRRRPSPIHTTFTNLPLLNHNHTTPNTSNTKPLPISIPSLPQNAPEPNSGHSSLSGPSAAKAFLMALGMTSPVGIQGQPQEQQPNSAPASQLSRTRSLNLANPSIKLSRHKSVSTTSNAYSTGTLFAKSRTNSISESFHSASPQSSQPQSPAASFLSAFAERTSPKSPQVNEEGEEVGGYVLGKVLGRGMFSVVRKAFTMRDQLDKIKVVAVKIIKKEPDAGDAENNIPVPTLTGTTTAGRNATTDESSDTFLDRELDIWRQLDHPHLIKMIEVVDQPQATFIFCDYCPGGDMLTYLRRKGNPGLIESEAARLWTQLASAVLYLHEILRVVHRDIKLENILLSETGDVKLGDFGFADYLHHNDRLAAIPVTMGSLAYCAPELVRPQKSLSDVSPASIPTRLRAGDSWALGVILFAFITGSLPFADEFEPRMILKISNVQYAWSSSTPNLPPALSASGSPSSAACSDTSPSARAIPSASSEHPHATYADEAPLAHSTPSPHQPGTAHSPGNNTSSCSRSSSVSHSPSSAASFLTSSSLSGCSSSSSVPSTSTPRPASFALADRHSCRTHPKSMGSPLVRSLVAGLFVANWWERWTVRTALESPWVRSFRD